MGESNNSKNIFYILGGIFVLIIASVIGYYYLVTLPGIEKDKLDYQRWYDQQQLQEQQAQKAQAIIDEYTKQCKKGYAGATAQFLNTLNQCTNQACIDNLTKSNSPLLIPSYKVFMSICISRKQQGLGTFDDSMQ